MGGFVLFWFLSFLFLFLLETVHRGLFGLVSTRKTERPDFFNFITHHKVTAA